MESLASLLREYHAGGDVVDARVICRTESATMVALSWRVTLVFTGNASDRNSGRERIRVFVAGRPMVYGLTADLLRALRSVTAAAPGDRDSYAAIVLAAVEWKADGLLPEGRLKGGDVDALVQSLGLSGRDLGRGVYHAVGRDATMMAALDTGRVTVIMDRHVFHLRLEDEAERWRAKRLLRMA